LFENEISTLKTIQQIQIDQLQNQLTQNTTILTQKEYELKRMEEKWKQSENWYQQMTNKLQEKEKQIFLLKEEMTQIQTRHLEAENVLIIHQLRHEKHHMQQEYTNQIDALRVTLTKKEQENKEILIQLENLQKNFKQQLLPSLAAASVQKTSETWYKKCQSMKKLLIEEYQDQLSILIEENKQQQNKWTQENHFLQEKNKQFQMENVFLKKEIHRLEENNTILLEQLHTIRVYLTQRPLLSKNTTTTTNGPQQYQEDMYMQAQLGQLHAQMQKIFEQEEKEKQTKHNHCCFVGTTSSTSPNTTSTSSTTSTNSTSSHYKVDALRQAENELKAADMLFHQVLDEKLKQKEKFVNALESMGFSSNPWGIVPFVFMDSPIKNHLSNVHMDIVENVLHSTTFPSSPSLSLSPTTPTTTPTTPTTTPNTTMTTTNTTLWYQPNYWKSKYS
jgi:hypothetical protein